MKYNSYNSQTFEYIGEGEVEYDPLEGKPTIPGHSTLTPIPTTITKGFVVVYDVSKDIWTEIEDNRGTVYDISTASPQQFNDLDLLPSTFTFKKPASNNHSWDGTKWVLDLVKVKAEKINTIKAEYLVLLESGVKYKTFTFQSDNVSVSTLTETLTALSNGWVLPTGFAWIDSTNTAHPADIVFLKGLSSALADHKSSLFTRLQTAKAAVNSASTATKIKAQQL